MPVLICLVLVLAWAPAAGRAATNAIATAIETNFRMPVLPLSRSSSHRRSFHPCGGVRNPPFEAYRFLVSLAHAKRNSRFGREAAFLLCVEQRSWGRYCMGVEMLESKWAVRRFRALAEPPHRAWFRVSEAGNNWRQPIEQYYDLAHSTQERIGLREALQSPDSSLRLRPSG